MRSCEWCRGPMPTRARRHARFCSPAHRAAAHRNPLPAELRELPRWTRHRHKRPVQVDGSPASSTDPATWTSYANVRAFGEQGFVLAGDGIVCLDLDHCLHATGTVRAWARPLLERLPATYVERSPSGDGLHVWGRGVVPVGRRIGVGGGTVEVYGTGRFMTVTGCRFSATSVLADLSPVLASLL